MNTHVRVHIHIHTHTHTHITLSHLSFILSAGATQLCTSHDIEDNNSE